MEQIRSIGQCRGCSISYSSKDTQQTRLLCPLLQQVLGKAANRSSGLPTYFYAVAAATPMCYLAGYNVEGNPLLRFAAFPKTCWSSGQSSRVCCVSLEE